MTEIIVQPLAADQARALTDEVKADAASLWAKLLALYEGQAHVALGYSSWAAYCAEEFEMGRDYSYKLLDSARVLEAVGESTNGRPATERVARELVPVLRDAPERVEEVWTDVVQEHGPTPTAAQVRQHVNGHQEANVATDTMPTRTVQNAQADKRRIETLVGTCQAWDRALDEVKVELAAKVATTEELADWRDCVNAAIKALRRFEQRIPKEA